MKVLVPLAAIAAGVFVVVRRRRSAQADADLWREATAGNTAVKQP